MRTTTLLRTPVDTLLGSVVARGELPLVVAVAANEHGTIYEGSAGTVSPGSAESVGPDSLLRIASMTKIATTVAALQLRDADLLDFDDPVDSFCPDFAAVGVLEGVVDGTPAIRPAARRATVRQLVTHTAGLTYGFWNADLARWEAAARPSSLFDAPLMADPGTRFEYGTSTDWLGRVIEVVSGQTLDRYLDAQVLKPLDMRSTVFRRSAQQRAACVPVHELDDRGHWVATDLDWDQHPRYWPGGHGLYSTPRDYLRFQRMLLCGGVLDRSRVLAQASVREMFTNQIGVLAFPSTITTADPAASCDHVVGPGMKWGWGLMLNPGDLPGRRAAGSGAWAGMFNTYFWVDPARRVTGALYSQCRPFQLPTAVRVYEAFEQAVYASR